MMRDKLENRIGVLAGVRNRIKSLALPSTTSNKYNNSSCSNNSSSSSSSSSNNNNREKERDNSSKNDDNDGNRNGMKRSNLCCRSDITLNDVANKMKPLFPKSSKNQSLNKNSNNSSSSNKNTNNINDQHTHTGGREELLLYNNSNKGNDINSTNTLKYQSTYDVCVYSASYTCQEAKEGNAVAVTVRIQVKNTSL